MAGNIGRVFWTVSKTLRTMSQAGFIPQVLETFSTTDTKCSGKLGYGGYSTIWLTNDVLTSRYVALKFIRAAQSENCAELEVLRKLESGPAEYPGKKHVASLETSFKFDGPNGQHLCLDSEVAGPSITDIRSNMPTSYCRLRADIARKVAKQTAEALDFIYSGNLSWRYVGRQRGTC